MISPQDVVLRLLIALVLCGAIGGERFLAGKAAGFRTHILVGVGSALFTIVSGYAFHTTASNADRIAAQVVTGIGFIGGGAILKEHGSIRGLTTAAGLWTVAAIGMAAGAGMFAVGGFGAAIILLTLVVLHRAEELLPRRIQQYWVVQFTLAEEEDPAPVRAALAATARSVTLEGMATQDGQLRVVLHADLPRTADMHGLIGRLRAVGATSVEVWSAGTAETETPL